MDTATTGIDAGCTIISKNYLAHARTLYKSFKQHNPEAFFFVLMVDKNDGFLDLTDEPFKVIEVESLKIPNFNHVAFRFDVLELNTNVKPTFLKYLLKNYGVSRLIYFDPDILVYRPLDELFDLLKEKAVLLTPHLLSPITDDLRPSEQDFLISGIFNLGFIGINNSDESWRFLCWWEKRCLSLGFSERRTGLFVDQKWINLVPCFFNSVYILKDPGYNMAYWNLHERFLDKNDNKWVVNGQTPLKFFHFSGLTVNYATQISHYQNRYDLNSRPELITIFSDYRNLLVDNGFLDVKELPYAYGVFTNGEKIIHLARRMFAVHESDFVGENPFEAQAKVYQWCVRNGFVGNRDDFGNYNSRNYNAMNWKIKLISIMLRVILKIFGANHYTMLMTYLSYISIIRNQKNIFKV